MENHTIVTLKKGEGPFFTRYRACLFLDKAAGKTYYGVIPQHPV